MDNQTKHSLNESSLIVAREINRVCDRFESAWRSGLQPTIETYLAPLAAGVRPQAFAELLAVELDLRRQRGETPEPSEYARRFPEFTTTIEATFSFDADLTAQYSSSSNDSAIGPDHASVDTQPLHSTPANDAACDNRPPMPSASRVAGALPTVGDYELLDELGRGGMGVVYRARQQSANRIVALKLIRTDRLAGVSAEQQRDALARFRLEAQLTAQLDHEHLVTVYEVGEADGQPFYSMKFVDGKSLHELLRDGPLDNRRAARLLESAARGVHEAHLHAILHRDLKPHNILIESKSDRSLVTDFGLAKLTEGDRGMSMTGEVFGTPQYMSPEQAIDSSRATSLSDVYGLGATMYHALTGRPPFQAASPLETLKQVLEQEPVCPRELNAAVDLDLETICLKAIAKESSRRYANADLLAADLRSYLSGEPIMARPVSSLERGWRWCRRNPTVAILTALLAGVMVSGAAISSALAVRSAGLADSAQANARQARAEKEAAEHLLYVSDMNVANQMVDRNQPEDAAVVLTRHKPGRDETSQSRWEWNYLWNECHRDLRTLSGHVGSIESIAISRDERRIVSGGTDGTIRVWNTDTGDLLRTFTGQPREEITSVAVSADGRRVISGNLQHRTATIRLWDIDTGRPIRTFPGGGEERVGAGFSPDGQHVVATGENGTVNLWEVETGRLLRSFESPKANIALFSVDGQSILSSAGSLIHLWNSASGQKERTFKGHTGAVKAVSLSGDGHTMASVCDRGLVILWNLQTGAILGEVKPKSSGAVALTADGETLAIGGRNCTIKLLSTKTREEVSSLQGHSESVKALCFTSDGRRIASGSRDTTIKIWKVRKNNNPDVVPRSIEWADKVAFSSDGNRLLASGLSTIQVWDTRTRQELWQHRNYRDFHSVWFSPDGLEVIAASRSSSTIQQVFDAQSGKALRQFNHQLVKTLCPSPDGRQIACAVNGTVELFDIFAKKDSMSRDLGKNHIEIGAFSPDGRSIMAGSFFTLYSLDAQTLITRWATPPMTRIQWPLKSVCFSPDSRLVAAGYDDGRVRLWNAATGAELHMFRLHAGAVRSLSFTQDGQRVVSGSEDETARIWEPETGLVLRTLEGYGKTASSVAFDPLGRRLAVAAGKVYLHDSTILTPDEKMGQFHVDRFFDTLESAEQVIDAVQHAEHWNQAMRDAGLVYARQRTARFPQATEPPASQINKGDLQSNTLKSE